MVLSTRTSSFDKKKLELFRIKNDQGRVVPFYIKGFLQLVHSRLSHGFNRGSSTLPFVPRF